MENDVFITCAVTGAGDVVDKHPDIPITPASIAKAAINAAQAGAAIAHIHVRNPETGRASRRIDLYCETVRLIRASGVDVVLNLTTGMGGDLEIGADNPMNFGPLTDFVSVEERVAHVLELKPEICTLDCGTLNFGDANTVYVATPAQLRTAARLINQSGVRPELEVFELGHLRFVNRLVQEGLVNKPVLIQFCLGIPWGAPADTATMKVMADAIPPGAIWSGFGIGRSQMPMVAQAFILGGNVRVGLEDNLYLDRGKLASNEDLVQRAIEILTRLGARILGPADVRAKLRLGS